MNIRSPLLRETVSKKTSGLSLHNAVIAVLEAKAGSALRPYRSTLPLLLLKGSAQMQLHW